MTEQYIIVKHSVCFEWERKLEVCIVNDYNLALAIIEYLKEHDEPDKDESGEDVIPEYWITRKLVFTDLDDFIMYWGE